MWPRHGRCFRRHGPGATPASLLTRLPTGYSPALLTSPPSELTPLPHESRLSIDGRKTSHRFCFQRRRDFTNLTLLGAILNANCAEP